MGWFGKLTLGTLGLFMGGPLGAIAGAVLGHHLFDRSDRAEPETTLPFGQADQAQAAYFVCLFSILSKMAKADGVVTKEEINIVDHFISNLRIPDDERQFARNIFNEAKKSPYTIDDFASQLFRMNQAQPTILLSFMDLLFKIASADGKLHEAEEASLNRLKEIFRISDTQFKNLKSVYFRQDDMYFRTLNCTKESTDDEIKTNYRKLVKEYHPDMLTSKGMPEEFIEASSRKFQEIQEAYEKVRDERGF
jgi:DnaJ like chaperone protein